MTRETILMLFKDQDIVIWEGIIAEFSVIKSFIEDGDKITIAHERELKQYRNSQL